MPRTKESSRKGVAVKLAIAEAKRNGVAQYLQEWGLIVHPDGSRTQVKAVEVTAPVAAATPEDMQTEIAAEAEMPETAAEATAPVELAGRREDWPVEEPPIAPYEPRLRDTPQPAPVVLGDEAEAPLPSSETPPPYGKSPALIGAEVAAALPEGTDAIRAEYIRLAAMGCSEIEIQALLNSKFGGGDRPPTPGDPGGVRTAGDGDRALMHADPAMVEAYRVKMLTYVEPKLDVKISVENPDNKDEPWTAMLPLRFIDYLVRSANLEELKRRRPVNPADRLQQILREYRRDDQDAKVTLYPSATGPAGAFKPSAGEWS